MKIFPPAIRQYWRMIVLSVGLLLLSTTAFVGYSIANYLRTPIEIALPLQFDIAPGSPLQRVTANLSDQGYLPRPELLNLWARWQGVGNAIKAGEYEITTALTPIQLLEKMVSGETRQYQLTLLEGKTFAQALDAIWQSEKIVPSLKGLDTAAIAQQMSLNLENPEGLLFPDTYFYSSGTLDIDILIRANTRLNSILESAWERRLGALPYESAYDALIMASIIEKESGLLAEQSHIAGVFVRRLEQGMRLQSDPTVIYGMGSDYAGNIRRSDLRETTAYNTYRIDGLPPTPIALAGRESIEASLNPLQSDYLYFVAKGDGSHYFSATLEEHNEAVQRYQRQN